MYSNLWERHGSRNRRLVGHIGPTVRKKKNMNSRAKTASSFVFSQELQSTSGSPHINSSNLDNPCRYAQRLIYSVILEPSKDLPPFTSIYYHTWQEHFTYKDFPHRHLTLLINDTSLIPGP